MGNTKELTPDVRKVILESSLFQGASSYVHNLVLQKVSQKSFKAGDPIFLENEESPYVYFVVKGEVEIQHSNLVKEVCVVSRHTQGDHFSEFSVLSNSRHSTSAFAKKDTTLLLLEGKIFVEIMNENIVLCRGLVKTLANKIHAQLSSSFSVRPFASNLLNFSKEITQLLPMNYISKYRLIPVQFENNNLHVALTLPFKSEFFESFEKLNKGVNLLLYTIDDDEFEYLRKPIMNAYLGRDISMNLSNSPKSKVDDSSLEEFLKFSLAFSQLSSQILKGIAQKCTLSRYQKGQIIIEGNSPVDHIYIVKAGIVDLTKRVGDQPLSCHVERRNVYDSFAEVSVITNHWMSLSATAVTDCEVVGVPRDLFEELMQTTDFVLPLCIHLSDRLRELNRLPGIQLNLQDETQLTSITEITTLQASMERQVAPTIDIIDENPEQVLEQIMALGIRERASDVHIEFTDTQTKVRFRIDGVLNQILKPMDHEKGQALVNRIKLVSKSDITERRLPQDGQFTIKVKDELVSGRVSTVPTKFGEKVVIRILQQKTHIVPLSQIAHDRRVIQFLNDLTKYRQGLFLVCGPTGSGKTTTLYSILGKLNAQRYNIVTIEDPIELDMEGINQIQINNEIGLTYEALLRHVMRQDPDIILVGEIRDAHSLQLVFDASLTGHLVLATLHASSSLDVFPRLAELGASTEQLASCLIGVVAQRLVRSVCQSCKSTKAISSHEIELFTPIKGASDIPPQISFGRGCKVCNYTGFYSRVPIFEYWEKTQDIGLQLMNNASFKEIVNVIQSSPGFEDLTTYGLRLAKNGITTVEEVESLLFGLNDIFEKEKEKKSA